MRPAILACITALAMPSMALAQSGSVEVRFTGARPGGPIMVQLGTEAEFMRPSRFQTMVAANADGTAVARFTGVPAGRYAVSSFQDVNRDGRLTFGGMMGAPVEPWGYSRGARGVMGPPRFEDAAMRVGPNGGVITVALEL
jgi:uncharacterized protein (DUF2141 family)